MERPGLVTFQGEPLTLVGEEITVGMTAPDFTALDRKFKPILLSDFKGQTVVISSVPSLDTPVCEMQTKKFNQEATALNAKIITISMDLPFAQNRFCDAFHIDNLTLLSDFKMHDFGNKYGLLIEELGLLARAVLIVDANNHIIYYELVKEIGQEPNYKAVLDKIKH